MDPRLVAEFQLIQKYYPDAELREDGWIRLPKVFLPTGIWNHDIVEIAIQAPPGYPGNPPYGIYVKPGLRLKSSNEKPGAYEDSLTTPFGEGWGKFSWQHDGWRASADLTAGSNLRNFIQTFAERFREAS